MATLNGPRTAPTLEMVAAEAGVSRSTVSRVVNGSPKVRPEVVDAVNRAIERLNYVPNRAARSLASRQTNAIALLVPEDTTRFFGDPYFAAIVEGITDRLDDSDYILNLLVASADPGRKTRRYLQGGNVDGALVVSHHNADNDLMQLELGLPLVFGGRPDVADLTGCFYVDVDNVAGSCVATQHLIDQGRRRIATITGPLDMPASMDRRAGCLRALSANGLSCVGEANGDFSRHGGELAMRDLLDRQPELDAIFVASDLMARGAMEALADRRRTVPGDVAVVGFDDSDAAISGQIHLTTIRQPSVEMGSRMAEILLDILHGHPPESPAVIMPTNLVVRDSA